MIENAMNGADLFAIDYKPEPFWWDAAPPRPPVPAELPGRTDVLVVGSGYTGLHAALQTARAGRDTLVLDAECLGFGCSTRNGGQVSTSVKGTARDLAARFGEELGFRIFAEGLHALDYLRDFIESERLDCDWREVGRFVGAHRPGRYAMLARRIENQPRGLEVEAHMVPRSEQHSEIGSDLYHGGLVYPQHASLHPAKYHRELLRRVEGAGAVLVGSCPVTRIEREGATFRAHTPKGTILARDVILATNGYSGPLSPWHRRRVIPIGSYIIATEPLPESLATVLSPRDRVLNDTRQVVYYYRVDRTYRRCIFGGRVALRETDPSVSAPRLHAAMRGIFPELATVRITHSWVGFVAYTFDTLPHIGRHDGVHFAMGYCGSGVSLASYLGMRIGQRVLGSADGRTALDDIAFPTRPLYSGDPWFLAPSLLYYKVCDRLAS
jgi:glycine/D-amino acid oxidase-like deaminating enzyme